MEGPELDGRVAAISHCVREGPHVGAAADVVLASRSQRERHEAFCGKARDDGVQRSHRYWRALGV